MCQDLFKKKHALDTMFYCLICNFNTSGTFSKGSSIRTCPGCGSKLVWCWNCRKYLSSIDEGEKVICGQCKNEISDDDIIKGVKNEA
jgi:transcription elongation factor Elf1